MANYGFTDGKNKQTMYSKTEADSAIEAAAEELQTQIEGLLTSKQDKAVTKTTTLTVAGWSSKQQTKNVPGVTASNIVIVSADPDDVYEYGSNGIVCIAQAANSLTFKCAEVPSDDIDVNVLIFGV